MKKYKVILLPFIAFIIILFSGCNSGSGPNGFDCKIDVTTSSETVGVNQILYISYTLSKSAGESYMLNRIFGKL
jgi:hypothetical protein